MMNNAAEAAAINMGGLGSWSGRVPESLHDLLENLYRRQAALDPNNAYLREQGSPAGLVNRIRTFQWYRPFLSSSQTILDWGCQHAPDSCLLRASFGDSINLHSCDFVEAAQYPVFHEFARSTHSRLDDPIVLPYASNFFDAVIGSGVLEHTAMDYESLKQLHRVLKPHGLLIVSYLPNWLSFHEWMRREVRKENFHLRLYGISETIQLLKRSGFYPLEVRYNTFFWERLAAIVGLRKWQRSVSSILGRCLPIQVFSSTLCFVARKMGGM